MTPHVYFGWCQRCNSPKYVQAFSMGPVTPFCQCPGVVDAEIEALMAAVDHGRAFDHRAKLRRFQLLQDAPQAFLKGLQGSLKALEIALVTDDAPEALEALVELVAMTRYAVTDHEALAGVRGLL